MKSFFRLAQPRALGSHATCTLLLRRPCQVQLQQLQQLQHMRRFTTTPTRRHADPRAQGPTSTSTNTSTPSTSTAATDGGAAPAATAATRPGGSTNFYRTHGRALFKALTLAFFSYQVIYWAWLTLETEEIKDQKNREIAALEDQVRQLDEARRKTSS